MGAGGPELPLKSPVKTHISETGGANSGARSAPTGPESTPVDPDLQRLVNAWPTLPEPIRAAVLALVGTGPSGTETETPTDGGQASTSHPATPES